MRKRVVRSYEVAYPDAIRVSQGDSLTIVREESSPAWKGWAWCRAKDGKEGWISKDFMSIEGSQGTMKQDYDAKEVAVKPDEFVEILKEEHGWSLVRKGDGSEGWIPDQCFEADARLFRGKLC